MAYSGMMGAARLALAWLPARREEVHHAKEEGIDFRLLNNPVEVLGNEEGREDHYEHEQVVHRHRKLDGVCRVVLRGTVGTELLKDQQAEGDGDGDVCDRHLRRFPCVDVLLPAVHQPEVEGHQYHEDYDENDLQVRFDASHVPCHALAL